MEEFSDLVQVGSGGFGTVWKAKRKNDGAVVAVKVLENITDPESIQRFTREIRILSEMDHPNIVKVIGKNLIKPPLYYVMPLYQKSLADEILNIDGDQARIKNLFLKVLDAVEYAHKQGILHRDLKSQNILLNSDDDLVVTDFGLGRRLDSSSIRLTLTGYGLGSPLYMAPEQIDDAKRATSASDVYSLGRILLELCQGWISLAPIDYAFIPPSVAVLLRRCFDINPDKRFKSVADLKQAFVSIYDATILESIADEFRQLISRLSIDALSKSEDVAQFVRGMMANLDDHDLVLEAIMTVEPTVFNEIEFQDGEALKTILHRFIEIVESQRWPFAFTDRIAAVADNIFHSIGNYDLRAELICCLIDLGASHNRYKVMQIAGRLLAEGKGPGEVLPLIEILKKRGNLHRRIDDHIPFNRLDPALKSFFDENEEETPF